MPKNMPREGSATEKVLQTMRKVEQLGFEMVAPEMEKPSLQAAVNRLKKQHFDNADFYTRTKGDGTVIIGLWKD